METARAQFCACHACTQARLAERRRTTTGLSGWFDVLAVALLLILGVAYFAT
jgi:hypothetical protein